MEVWRIVAASLMLLFNISWYVRDKDKWSMFFSGFWFCALLAALASVL